MSRPAERRVTTCKARYRRTTWINGIVQSESDLRCTYGRCWKHLRALATQEVKMPEIDQSARKHRWKYRWSYTGMTPELGYVLGTYFGDGTVVAAKSSLKFILTVIDRDFAEYTRECCCRLLKAELPPVTPLFYNVKSDKRPIFRTAVCSGDLASWLVNITNCKGYIPDCIPRDPGNPILLNFLAGFMDSDGFICYRIKKGELPAKSTNWQVGFGGVYPWVHEITALLKAEGCDVRGPWIIQRSQKNKVYFDYRITPKTFALSRVYFRLKRKQDRLVLLREKVSIECPTETECHTPEMGEETVQ